MYILRLSSIGFNGYAFRPSLGLICSRGSLSQRAGNSTPFERAAREMETLILATSKSVHTDEYIPACAGTQ